MDEARGLFDSPTHRHNLGGGSLWTRMLPVLSVLSVVCLLGTPAIGAPGFKKFRAPLSGTVYAARIREHRRVRDERGGSMRKERPRDKQRNRLRRTALLVFAITACLTLVPVVPAASQSTSSRVITAPYSGSATSIITRGITACGTAKFVHPATFNLRTGIGGWADSATGKTCGKYWGGSQGEGWAEAQFLLTINIPAKKALLAPTMIVAAWAFGLNGSTTLVSGACSPSFSASSSGCTTFAQIYILASAQIYDVSNGSLTNSSNSWAGFYNGTDYLKLCNYGSCIGGLIGTPGNFSYSVSPSWFFNVSGMKATHHYQLMISIFGSTSAGTSVVSAGLTGAAASASADFYSFGDGAHLSSITET